MCSQGTQIPAKTITLDPAPRGIDQENACLPLQRSDGADLEMHSVESNCWT
jgi:hypothetical protein